MTFDFDQPIDRRNSHSSKWDEMEAVFGLPSSEGIPLWVADMDFLPPPAVNQALAKAISLGVHGYFGDSREYKSAIINWMKTRHGWTPEPEWIAVSHEIVAGIANCLKAFTQPGDGVIVFTPVYHAFARVIKANHCQVVESPLLEVEVRYQIDLAALAKKLTGKERVIIMCSPHNPGGTVWTPAELKAVADFAADHDLLILSDEIHADLVFSGNKHTVMPLAAPEHMDRIIMLTAATKTFNTAGALVGNVTIANPELRSKYAAASIAAGYDNVRLCILVATAAYQSGAEWLDALLLYLDENRKLVDQSLCAIPGFRSMPLQATYLAWLDLSGTGMSDAEIAKRMVEHAKVAVYSGPVFGHGGAGRIRLNFATQRHLLKQGIERIQSAFADLQ